MLLRKFEAMLTSSMRSRSGTPSDDFLITDAELARASIRAGAKSTRSS